MKKLLLFFLLLSTYVCNADSWTRKADFPGPIRRDAYGFAIGNKAYVGGGGSNDLWEYDPVTDTWNQKNNPPFTSPGWQSGWGIGGYGYVYIDSANEFWQYAPLTDTWTREADLPGIAKHYPASFVIGNILYVVCGLSDSLYSYDPASNTWTGLANMPYVFGEAVGFSVNNKGYITGMLDASGGLCSPYVFEYDPAANSWTQKANFPGIARTEGAAFNIENIAYFGVGDSDAGGTFKDWWEYDSYTDSWITRTPIPSANGKDEDPYFVVDYRGFIIFGSDNVPSNEVWEYTPDSLLAVHNVANPVLKINVFPNPATTMLTIQSTNAPITDIGITNVLGQEVSRQAIVGSLQVGVDVSTFPAGVYFVKVNGSVVRKFVKE